MHRSPRKNSASFSGSSKIPPEQLPISLDTLPAQQPQQKHLIRPSLTPQPSQQPDQLPQAFIDQFNQPFASLVAPHLDAPPLSSSSTSRALNVNSAPNRSVTVGLPLSSLERRTRNNCFTRSDHKQHYARLRRIADSSPRSRVAQVASKSLLCNSNAIVLESPDKVVSFVPLICKRKWCPQCMRLWSAALTTALLRRTAGIPFAHIRHITLTIPNARRGELRRGVDVVIESFRRWKNQGRRSRPSWWSGVQGYFAKLEITYSWNKFWHPHIHVAIHVPQGFDLTADSAARAAWTTITNNLHARAICIWISKPEDEFNSVQEFTKYTTKFVTLDEINTREMAELIGATDRVRWHQSHGTLRISLAQQNRGHARLGKLHDIAMLACDTKADESVQAWALSIVRLWAESHDQKDPRYENFADWLWQI